MITLRQDKYVKANLAEDMTDDRQLCCDLRELLNEQHMHCGYFSKGFDIKHLNTRLALHDEAFIDARLHMDVIWKFKGWRGVSFGGASMKVVARELGLTQKPEVPSKVWMPAKAGNKKAMDEVCKRCEADVYITQEILEWTMDRNMWKNIQLYP